MHVGLTGSAEWRVTDDMTASRIGSGLVNVLSTPMLIALMEAAAVQALDGKLPAGQTSVGVRIDAAHLAATPVGVIVRATATLREVDDKKLVFAVEAWDEHEKIGSATHVRFVVNQARFEARAAEKSSAP